MTAQCTGGAGLKALSGGGGAGGVRRRRTMVVPKSTFTSFMDEGFMHLKKMAHKKAKFCFESALDLKPDDPLALISRSQCNMSLGLHDEALKDAEQTFKLNKNFTPGLFQFGEVLFSLGYFEEALVYYHRGRRLRKNAVEFHIGIAKAENAIRNAILDRAATQIEDIDEIIPLIDEIENEDSRVQPQCCIYSTGEENRTEKWAPLLPPRNKNRERWVTREILRDLANHKFFAQKSLAKLSDPRKQLGKSTKVKDNLAEILFFIEHHERLLRHMKPMYYRKYGLNFNQSKVNEIEKEILGKQNTNLILMKNTAEDAIFKAVIQIEHSLSMARYSDAQLAAERCIRQLQKISSKLIERKHEFIVDLMHYRGVSILRQKNYTHAVNVFKHELKLGQNLKDNSVISRSLDFQARAHALKGEYNEAIESWEARLDYAKTPLEKVYTYHEIGRSHLELGKKELARYYAVESLSIANDTKIYIWAIFARVLLGQIELKSGNFSEALIQFEGAKVVAAKTQNSHTMDTMLDEMIYFLRVCIDHRHSEDIERSHLKTSEVSEGSDDVDNITDTELTTPGEVVTPGGRASAISRGSANAETEE